jgi:N-acyl homoserine lactone hydrolase
MPEIIELLDGVPAASDQGQLAFCSVLLVEGTDRDGTTKRMLVDTAHVGRRQLLVDALARRGLTTQDIDFVLCSHAHWDHMQNNDLFTNASLLIHPAERRYAHTPAVDDWATPSWTGYLLEQLPIIEVGDGYEVFPGVTVVDMGGHTAGTIGAAIETDRGLAMATSDAIHIASAAVNEVNPLVFWDERSASDTIRRIKKEADVIYPGHDSPFRVLADGSVAYDRTIGLGIGGTTPTVLSLGSVLQAVVMPGRQDRTPADIAAEVDAARLDAVRAAVRAPYAAGAFPVPSGDWERQS